MPVIGHKFTWSEVVVSENLAHMGRHYVGTCECGLRLRGRQAEIHAKAFEHLEKHEYLQFRGTR